MLLDIVNVKLLSVWILLSFFEECWDGSWGGQVVELLIDTINAFKSCSGAFFRVSLKQWFYISFPTSSDGKESVCSAGDLSSIPGLGRSPREGNGNPLHILARRIPWTEKPRHSDWTTNTTAYFVVKLKRTFVGRWDLLLFISSFLCFLLGAFWEMTEMSILCDIFQLEMPLVSLIF